MDSHSSHSTHSFRYYNYPFGYGSHRLLGSARLSMTAEISCQYLASCLALGCGSLRSDFMNTLWDDEYQHYTFHLSHIYNGFFKMQSVWLVSIIVNRRILPDTKCNFHWQLLLNLVKMLILIWCIWWLIQRWIITVNTYDHSMFGLFL